MMKIFKKNADVVRVLLIAIFALVLLSYNIQKPFIGQHDWNGAFWGGVARNYIGNISEFARIGVYKNIDTATPDQVVFLNHYTPFLPILFTVSGFIFGLSEMSIRLVTVFFSVLMIIFIYKIGKFLYSKDVGILAALFTLATPMFLYYGKLPDHEPILASLCTIAFYFYITANKKNPEKQLLLYLSLLFALLESWGGFFFLFFLILHSIFVSRSKISFIISLVGMGISVLLFQALLIIVIQSPGSIGGFLDYGLLRMNLNASDPMVVKYSLSKFVSTEARYLVVYYTRLLLFLSSIWIVKNIINFRKINSSDKSLSILFVYGAFFVLVFNNLAFIHDYKLYLLLPFIAISAAQIIHTAFSKINSSIENYFVRKNLIYIKIIFLAILIFLISFERVSFLRSILQSSFDKPGYELGKYIFSKTNPSDKILINSREYDSFYRVFVLYYANRKVDAEDLTMDYFIKNIPKYNNYRYIILVENRPVDKKLEQYLIKTYPLDKLGIYSFVDLHAKKYSN